MYNILKIDRYYFKIVKVNKLIHKHMNILKYLLLYSEHNFSIYNHQIIYLCKWTLYYITYGLLLYYFKRRIYYTLSGDSTLTLVPWWGRTSALSLLGKKCIGKIIIQILFSHFPIDEVYSILYFVSTPLKGNITCNLFETVRCNIGHYQAAY